jgi:serine/threonine protein kinase, bacterial
MIVVRRACIAAISLLPLALAACAGAYVTPSHGLPAQAERSRVPGYCPCLYVANRSRPDRITIYFSGKRQSPARYISGTRTGLAGAWGVAVDGSGQLYVANSFANTITVYAANAHKNAAPVATIAGTYTGLNQPSGLALDPSGNLYVANYAGNSIEVFAPGSNGDVSPSQSIAGSYTSLNGPTGVALDDAGNIYASNSQSSSITVYPAGSNGNAAPSAQIGGPSSSLDTPSAIAVDGSGNMYVTNSGAHGPPYSVNVYAAGSNGNAVPLQYITGGKTQLNVPFGIALDPSGNVYAGNFGSNTVTTYAPGANGDVRPIGVLRGKKSRLQLPVGIAIR